MGKLKAKFLVGARWGLLKPHSLLPPRPLPPHLISHQAARKHDGPRTLTEDGDAEAKRGAWVCHSTFFPPGLWLLQPLLLPSWAHMDELAGGLWASRSR